MSNETKWDVFKVALDDWKQNFISSLPRDGSFEDWSESLSDYSARYAAALPDDLPVIPKAVGDVLAKLNHKKFSLSGAKSYAEVVSLSSWMTFEHEEDFARAWLLGVWRVEETGEIVKLEEEK
ncbi:MULTISPECIES: hypothetical protein [Lacticaseibacillus]|uniref:hypothetical protein n=1 Tax=Lacticaseibacillus TaxID=2759736 RepID=UPI00046A9747|nr:hypothetical protein [Lacticaseibacillus casei]MBI6598631.1 hypothetical protein [Lacticaseibacillus casei]MBO1482303.1 hypothetical protein [Lacticaseibacillus casei]MBO2417756.1 hypothetical protein [Lacticaseibacillus casei]MCK2081943.1 hypothetical protein [Lacticaseibacillus casei]MED7631859.1 hypothetical protein [Lacticaseibacillus casei]